MESFRITSAGPRARPLAGTVRPSVDTTYSGRYRVGHGAWREIPGTLTVAGPPATLRVDEARGVLVAH